MFSIESKGSFKGIESFLTKMSKSSAIFSVLDRYGQEGVNALSAATPVKTGLTSRSWTYEIVRDSKSYSIIWSNTNIVDGRPVAILLQYDHGTGNGGYVTGQDYINPALKPIFDRIAADVWKEVTSA